MRRPKLDSRLIPIYLATPLFTFSVNVFLPLIPILKNDLVTDTSLILLSITLFQLPFALGQFFSGGLSDVYGRRKIILMGFSILTIGFALTTFSINIWFFMVARIIQGLGLAFILPVIIALVGDLTDISSRGRYMGFLGSTTRAGTAVGPLVGGFLASQWRLLFMAMAGFSIGLLICFFVFLRKIAVKEGGRLSDTVEYLRETLRYRNVLILGIAGFLALFVFNAVVSISSDGLTVFPYYLDPDQIGIILSGGGFVGLFTATAAGFLTDRFGKRKILITGIVIIASALTILTFATTYSAPHLPISSIPNFLDESNLNYLIEGGQAFVNLLIIQILLRYLSEGIFIDFLILLSIMGIGTSFIWPGLLSLTVDVVPPKLRGASNSIFGGMRFVGLAIAPTALTPVYLLMGLDAVFITSVSLTPAMVALVYAVTRKEIEKAEIPKEKVESKPRVQKRKQKSHNKKLPHQK